MKDLSIMGTVLFTVYGQLIMKWRIGHYGPLPDDFYSKLIFLLHLFADAYIVSGFIAAFVASLFWMAVMTKIELSYAYPIITGGLTLLTTVMAILLFGETLSFAKVLGILLVMCGICLMQCN